MAEIAMFAQSGGARASRLIMYALKQSLKSIGTYLDQCGVERIADPAEALSSDSDQEKEEPERPDLSLTDYEDNQALIKKYYKQHCNPFAVQGVLVLFFAEGVQCPYDVLEVVLHVIFSMEDLPPWHAIPRATIHLARAHMQRAHEDFDSAMFYFSTVKDSNPPATHRLRVIQGVLHDCVLNASRAYHLMKGVASEVLLSDSRIPNTPGSSPDRIAALTIPPVTKDPTGGTGGPSLKSIRRSIEFAQMVLRLGPSQM
jgi:hypothetical protein